MSISTDLKTMLRSKGADLIGFADLRMLQPEVREDLPFGISIAVALDPKIVSRISQGPTPEYYEEYERLNGLLDSLGHQAVAFLEGNGYKAKFAASTDNSHFDANTLSMLLPHKTVATRAGIGWIGKCALLINRDFGSGIRLTSVLTDAELPAGVPIDHSHCGKCAVCVDVCPVDAPSGTNWTVGVERDSFLNASACRANARKMTLMRIGIERSVCGMCISVCPWTRKYINKYNSETKLGRSVEEAKLEST